MPMTLTHGPVPLYHQILEILRERIEAGAYGRAGRLPTEDALVREFAVARQTVRAAVQRLVDEGLVERFRGKGTFVGNGAKINWTIGSLDDLIGTSFDDEYRVVSARFEIARRHPDHAQVFGLSASDQMFVVHAVRSSGKGSYAFSEIHFPPDVGRKLPRRRFIERPLILMVEEYCGVRAHEARQLATACAADGEAARRLGVRPGTPVLVLERTYFTRSGRAIEAVRIHYHPDRFQHVVRFWRRQNSEISAMAILDPVPRVGQTSGSTR